MISVHIFAIVLALIAIGLHLINKRYQKHTNDLVEFDIGTLTPILTGMLGLAGMRSYEKTKNVHAK